MIFDAIQWGSFLRFRDAFESVMDPRFYTIDWLEGQVLTGRYRVFASDTAAIIAEIHTYPTWARELRGVVAAGDLKEIEEVLIPQAEEWGRTLSCITAQIDSRDGWQRVMKKHGYERHQTVLRKEL